MLGENEGLLQEICIEMDPEDGCLTVLGTGEETIAPSHASASKSNPDVLMVQTSEVRGRDDAVNGLNSTRRWCILVQR
jgi:hypothetical protein